MYHLVNFYDRMGHGRNRKRRGRFLNGEGSLSMTDITELYAPQFEQFGLKLQSAGPIFTGEVANPRGAGRAWIMPLSPTCLVMEHFITPGADMMLAEHTPEPYACVSEISAPTLECMPAAGIRPAALKPARGSWPANVVCSFVQDSCGVELSPLHAGELYHSRSIIFMPGYFDELEARYPGDFAGLFDAFSSPWNDEGMRAIGAALRRLDEGRAQAPAAHLYIKGVVDSMAAELACAHAAEGAARLAQGTHAATRLAEEAAALVERALDAGERIGVDEAAARLYVSRSKLCATFHEETGEALGAYMRRRRCERAQDLLCEDALSVAEVARRLGYPQTAAFSQAFKLQTGQTPTAWRAAHR